MSLFAHLAEVSDTDVSGPTRALVKREALVLKSLLGAATKDNDLMNGISAAMFGRHWSIGHARIFACWAAGADADKTDVKGESHCCSKSVSV